MIFWYLPALAPVTIKLLSLKYSSIFERFSAILLDRVSITQRLFKCVDNFLIERNILIFFVLRLKSKKKNQKIKKIKNNKVYEL